MAKKEFGRLGLIRHYFGVGEHGRKCTMDELKALSPADKQELGDQAIVATEAVKTDAGKYSVEVD